MKLSPRLLMLYHELVPRFSVVDLCCDHGYLGMHAYLSGRFPEIIFVDQAPLAMTLLEQNFNQYVKDEDNPTQVSFMTADAGKISNLLSGNVVIAGVGGKNMMQMLESLHQNQKLKPHRLILSPHRNPELFDQSELFGLKLTHTNSVVESGYERIVFVFDSI